MLVQWNKEFSVPLASAALIDIGVIGDFSGSPLLYVIGAEDLPDRREDFKADMKIAEAMKLLYQEAIKL